MNKRILIIAHAPLASALRQCALHVFPDCEQFVALDVQPNVSPEETLGSARIMLAQLGAAPTSRACWC
jgi:PTS system mannose-specific IIA component